jgi:asparagine synthase (glutamine-hydrolysing)
MLTDVPLGAFLSGGIDSSLITALMQAQSSTRIKTFSIGFNESRYNEARYAKEVARHLGTDHTELYVSSEHALAVLPTIARAYDEPFADSSQIPTLLLATLAKQSVTVALSGDGGDELFCGYNRYVVVNQLAEVLRLPYWSRRVLAKGLSALSPHAWRRFYRFIEVLLPKHKRFVTASDKRLKMAQVLLATSSQGIYCSFVSDTQALKTLLEPGNYSAELGGIEQAFALHGLPLTQRMMLADLLTYLPDDILVKVDRAGMAVSLETRMPFLDHRVIEFTTRLPLSVHYRNKQTKWLLRQLLHKYIPDTLINRPKMGFGIPLGTWLNGTLNAWACDLLHPNLLTQQGYFDVSAVQQLWQDHQSGKKNADTLVWNILMFQAWLCSDREESMTQ